MNPRDERQLALRAARGHIFLSDLSSSIRDKLCRSLTQIIDADRIRNEDDVVVLKRVKNYISQMNISADAKLVITKELHLI